jgi:hypothetical protein
LTNVYFDANLAIMGNGISRYAVERGVAAPGDRATLSGRFDQLGGRHR